MAAFLLQRSPARDRAPLSPRQVGEERKAGIVSAFVLSVFLLLIMLTGNATNTHADEQPPVAVPPPTYGQILNDAKADCQALLDSVLPFAEQMLVNHGTFYPYGGAMRPDGQIVTVGGYDGTEHP